MTTYDAIEAAKLHLYTVQCQYLRERGWHETCELPGSTWVWSTTLENGLRVGVSLEHAVKIAAMHEQYENVQEGCGA